MPMIVCMKCKKFFHPKKNGVTVEEGMPNGDKNVTETGWGSYKLWRADLLECLSCGDQIVAGFARDNFAEHYTQDYDSIREAYPPIVFVEDCC